MPLDFLADFDLTGMMAMMIPILALAIPIVVILTGHQRRMAEIIHSSQRSSNSGELEAIRQELQQLRMLMNQHTIALDDISNRQSTAPALSTVQERIGTS